MNTNILFLLVSLFPMFSATAQTREICFAIPLTGGQAAFGESVMRGAQFAQESIEKCAYTDPACPLKDTRLIFEDHSGEPARAIAAIQKLLNSHSCSAFVVFGSPTSIAVSDHLERAKKIAISIATSDKIQSGKKYVFRSMASAAAISKPLLAEASRLGLSRIVSISTIHDGMFAYRDAFEKIRGIAYEKTIEVTTGEIDLRALALQIKAINPDGIFITLLPPQAAIFTRQIRSLGYSGSLFAANQIESPDELLAAGTSFEGLWYAREGSLTSRDFDDAILRRFPDGKTIFALSAYDATKIITVSLNHKDPRTALENLKDYPGASGTISTLPDHSFSASTRLMLVRDGKFTMKN